MLNAYIGGEKMNKNKKNIQIFENAMEILIKGEIIPDKDVVRFMKLDKNTLLRVGLKFISKKSSSLTYDSSRILDLNLQNVFRFEKMNFLKFNIKSSLIPRYSVRAINSLQAIFEMQSKSKKILTKDIFQALIVINKDILVEQLFSFIFFRYSGYEKFEKNKRNTMTINEGISEEKINRAFYFGNKDFRSKEEVEYLFEQELKRMN